MKFLRQIGLVSGLVIGGVLGGLMAPLSSEAGVAPTITIQFDPDGGTAGQIYSLTLTRASSCPTGFSDCWELPTGGTYTTPNRTSSGGAPSRAYTITSFDTTNTGQKARLLVTDADTTGQDTITFTNTQIAPCVLNGSGFCDTSLLPTTANLSPVDWGSNTLNCGTCSTASPWGESHKIKVVITKRFEIANTKSTNSTTGLYAFSLRISGQFKGGPKDITGRTNGTASGDYINWDGVIELGKDANVTLNMLARPSTSSPTGNGQALPTGATACNATNSRSSDSGTGAADTRYCPLKKTFGYAATTPTVFSNAPPLQQGDGSSSQPYPVYFCDNSLTINASNPYGTGTSSGTATCTPKITITMIAGTFGPDAVQLTSSGDGTGGSCNLTSPDPGGGPSSNPAIPCHSNGNKNLSTKISKFFATQQAKDDAAVAATGAVYTPACEGDECPCWDSVLCTGTIAIIADVTPAAAVGLTFTGPDGLFTVNTQGYSGNPDLGCPPVEPFGTGCRAFTFSTMGVPYEFKSKQDDTSSTSPWYNLPGDINHRYDADSINCTSDKNIYVYDALGNLDLVNSVIVSTWTVDSSSFKTKATVTKLGRGDIVTCSYHVHKTSK